MIGEGLLLPTTYSVAQLAMLNTIAKWRISEKADPTLLFIHNCMQEKHYCKVADIWKGRSNL